MRRGLSHRTIIKVISNKYGVSSTLDLTEEQFFELLNDIKKMKPTGTAFRKIIKEQNKRDRQEAIEKRKLQANPIQTTR